MNRKAKKRVTRLRKRSRQWTLVFLGRHDRWSTLAFMLNRPLEMRLKYGKTTEKLRVSSTYGKTGFTGGSYELMRDGTEVINGIVST